MGGQREKEGGSEGGEWTRLGEKGRRGEDGGGRK